MSISCFDIYGYKLRFKRCAVGTNVRFQMDLSKVTLFLFLSFSAFVAVHLAKTYHAYVCLNSGMSFILTP